MKKVKSQLPTSRAKTAYGLLSEIRALILEEPLRYNQRDTLWMRGRRNGVGFQYSEAPNCGTVGCVAGWATALRYRGRRLPYDVMEYAQNMLGLAPQQANALFNSNAAGAFNDSQTAEHAKAGAKHIRRFQKKYRAQLLAKKV